MTFLHNVTQTLNPHGNPQLLAHQHLLPSLRWHWHICRCLCDTVLMYACIRIYCLMEYFPYAPHRQDNYLLVATQSNMRRFTDVLYKEKQNKQTNKIFKYIYVAGCNITVNTAWRCINLPDVLFYGQAFKSAFIT